MKYEMNIIMIQNVFIKYIIFLKATRDCEATFEDTRYLSPQLTEKFR